MADAAATIRDQVQILVIHPDAVAECQMVAEAAEIVKMPDRRFAVGPLREFRLKMCFDQVHVHL